MKLTSLLLLCSAVTGFAYKTSQSGLQTVLVSFPTHTEESIVDKAKDEMRALGAVIIYESNLVKGFTIRVTEDLKEKASASIAALKGDFEPDGPVTALSS